jgi:hypothetical protein
MTWHSWKVIYKRVFLLIILTLLITVNFISTQSLGVESHYDELSIEISDQITDDISAKEPNLPENNEQFFPLNTGGNLKWSYPTSEKTYISTPALVDLDMDNDLEIVFVSSGDAIYAISNTGGQLWKNSDYSILRADEFMTGGTSGSFFRPEFFSSITPVDIMNDEKTELLFSASNKIVCLSSSGTQLWNAGDSNRNYISTPAVIDLEGNMTTNKSDQDVLVIRDNTYTELQPQIFTNTGAIVATLARPYNWNDLGFSSISVADLDGSSTPDPRSDIIFGSHGPAMKLYSHTGTAYDRISESTGTWGTMVYGTGTIGDFVGDSEYEFFIGTYEGAIGSLNNPSACTGYYYLYDPINDSASTDQEFQLYRRSLPGANSGFIGSPVVGDVQGGLSSAVTGKVGYEAFIGSYNGILYSIDITSGDILWEFNTGGSIFSSPALCDINSDTILEVIVGSNNGMIYCLDGDPSDNTDEGISDSGGTDYDILWQYDTGGNGTWISSPVVADIDNDKNLEVLIGDRDGVLWCLNAGPSNITGQIDWPMFQYDGKNTGVIPTRSRTFNISFQIENGGGPNNKTCYAQLKPYSFKVEVDDGMGYSDLKHLILTFDPLGKNIQCKWSQVNKEFIVLNDADENIELISTSLNSITDNARQWNIEFKVLFNWSFDKNRPIDCAIKAIGQINPERSLFYTDFVTVISDLEYTGTMAITGENQGTLSPGMWIKGGENVTWSNLTVIYQDTDEVYPDKNKYSIILRDNNENIWEHIPSIEGEVLDFTATVPKTTEPNNEFYLNISKKSQGNSISTYGLAISLKIDSTPPEPPEKIIIHADSFEDTNTIADDDTTLYVTWTTSTQEYSGIKGYYYSFDNNGGTKDGTFTTENSAVILTAEPGQFDFYIWTEDMVGNLGSANLAEFYVDIEEISYSTYSPISLDWFNTPTVKAGVKISDGEGIGVDPSTIQYSILPSNSNNFGPWLSINQDEDLTWLQENVVKVESDITFSTPGINYLRWQAKDLAGNGYTLSEEIQLMIDTVQPRFENPGISLISVEEPRKINCNITVKDDDLSGINASSVQFRYSINGIENYSDWISLNKRVDNPIMLCEITLDFDYGDDNFINWRARDVAGNDYVISDDIRIRVNSPPIVKISSPINNTKFYIDDPVEFDASATFDPDANDVLSYFWVFSYTNQFGLKITDPLSSSPTFKHELKSGAVDIVVYVNDGKYNVSESVFVFIYDQYTDLDQDGMPDHWEEQYPGLDPNNRDDANLDLDGDGITNLEEYTAGTNPAEPTDYPGKTAPKKEEENNDFLLMNLIILILVIIILIALFFVKRSSIRKARFRERQARKPAMLIKREVTGAGMRGSRVPQIIPGTGGPQQMGFQSQYPQLSRTGESEPAGAGAAAQQTHMPQLPPHQPTVDKSTSKPQEQSQPQVQPQVQSQTQPPQPQQNQPQADSSQTSTPTPTMQSNDTKSSLDGLNYNLPSQESQNNEDTSTVGTVPQNKTTNSNANSTSNQGGDDK